MPGHLCARAETVSEVNRQLLDLLSRSGAAAALLVDESGALISRQGRMPEGDPAETATLLTCNFLVTHELAKYLGDQEITVLFHEGEKKNFYLRRVGERGILVVLFEDPGALGRIQLFTDKTASALTPSLHGILLDALPAGMLPPGFLADAQQVVDTVLRASTSRVLH